MAAERGVVVQRSECGATRSAKAANAVAAITATPATAPWLARKRPRTRNAPTYPPASGARAAGAGGRRGQRRLDIWRSSRMPDARIDQAVRQLDQQVDGHDVAAPIGNVPPCGTS